MPPSHWGKVCHRYERVDSSRFAVLILWFGTVVQESASDTDETKKKKAKIVSDSDEDVEDDS